MERLIGNIKMKASVSWQGKAQFMGRSGSGHEVLMDGPPDHGGENLGPRPMEMLLLGIGGCASFDVTHILKKSRKTPVSCSVEITAERSESVPAVFTKLHLCFKVSGENLKPALVERAVQLSAEKYCSASIMMQRAGVEVTHEFELLETDLS